MNSKKSILRDTENQLIKAAMARIRAIAVHLTVKILDQVMSWAEDAWANEY